MAAFGFTVTATAAPNSFTVLTGITGIADTDGGVTAPVVIDLPGVTTFKIIASAAPTAEALETALVTFLESRGYNRGAAGGGRAIAPATTRAPALTAVPAAL